ncbi:MAG TPA: glycoside hydrolase family 15 protein, partial [Labilithrix sp.]
MGLVRRFAPLALAFPLFAGCSSSGDDASSSDSDLFGIEPISTVLGNPPNFAQLGNGSAMSVVSRAEGRGSKAGALVELYWPHYASDNLWDSYVGITTPGQKLRWAHQLDLVAQRVVDDTGIVQSDFTAPGVSLRIEDVVAPGIDAHVRHVVVTNTGSEPLAGVDVTFYAFYTLHLLPGGDEVHWDAAHGALVQTDGDVTVATMGDRAPSASHCGLVFVPIGGQRDARGAAEAGHLTPCDHAGPSPAGVNGVLEHRLDTIPPGASKDVTYAMGLGHDEAHALAEASRALQGGFAARAADDRTHWSQELARAKMPAQLPADARAVYRRAIIAMLQHRVDDGAFIAASTLTSPVYKLVWPRDGSKTAIDLLEAGYADEAKAFFVFLEKQLLSDGSFAVNYQPDGSGPMFDFGASGNENDQPGMLPWGVDRVYAATQDRAWLAARWPAVQRVAEHILTITPDGLVAPSRDLWELETGGSWTYSNGSAIAGLEAAARIARATGHDGA